MALRFAPYRAALRDVWERLGLIAGISLTWAFGLSLALSVERLVPRAAPAVWHLLPPVLALLFLLPLLLGGAHHVAHLIATRDEAGYGDFWRGGARLYLPALALTLVDAGALAGLGVNLRFYAGLGHWYGVAACLLCLYLLLFAGMMAVAHFPLLVAQHAGVFDDPEHPARRDTRAVLRRAFFLALGRPFALIGLLIAVLLLTALCGLTGILFATLWPGLLALLSTHVTRALLVAFGVLPPPALEEAIVPDEKFRMRFRQD